MSLADKVAASVNVPTDQATDTLEQRAHRAAPAPDAESSDKADYAHARWHVQDDSYTGYAREWTQALLFLLKKHYWKWDAKTSRYAPEKNVPRWRQRPVTNLAYSVYRSGLAKLTKQRPTFDVVPASGDTDDRQSARLAEAILHQIWQQLGLSRTHHRTAGWLLATGNAFLRVHWDPEAGPIQPLTVPMPHPETGEEVDVPANEDGEPHLTEDGLPDLDAEPHRVAQGEVAVAVVSPFAIRFNPDAESPEDASEWFVGSLWPKAKAARQFGVSESALETETDDGLAQALDLVSAAAASSSKVDLGAGAAKGDEIGERVLVLEYYAKPCAEYPEGRHWVQVGRTTVSEEEGLPYGFWPPMVAVQDTPVPGQPWALGVIGQVVPLNDDYNKVSGLIRETQVMSARGKWIVDPADRTLNITTEPGQVLVSKAPIGSRPTQITAPPIGADLLNEREHIKGDAMFVSGMSENPVATSPSGGAPSGRSLLVQQEISNSVFEPTLLSLENAWAEVGRRILVLAREFYREDRILHTRGQAGEWEFTAFTGADLTESMDVQVQAGSLFPWAKSAKLDLAMTMLEKLPQLVMGADGASVDTQKLARYLDVGGIQAFQPEGDGDQLEIQREHAKFAAFTDGSDPQTIDPTELLGFWQDHAKHAAGHRELLKRDRGQFDQWHPIAQKNFLLHLQLTDQALQGIVQRLTPAPPPPPPDGGGAASGQSPVGAPGDPSSPEPTTADTTLTDADLGDAGLS